MDILLLKWIHIVSSTILFGTGLGSAFFKWRTDSSGDLYAIAVTNRNVVVADWIFTTPAVMIQPLTGILLAHSHGYSLFTPWILISLVLFGIAGLCWIPVVVLQIKMRNIALWCLNKNTQLPIKYWNFAKAWFWLGIPAFISLFSVFFLMVVKPVI